MNFGTDGVRGRFGSVVTEDLAGRLGNAAVQVLGERVLIARDTRPSSALLASAALAGVREAGGQAIDIGILPTPGLSVLIQVLGADGGLMITASHNPPEDNGVKALGSDGRKLDRNLLAALGAAAETRHKHKGGTNRAEPSAGDHYVAAVLAALPPGRWLHGRRILLDPAGGAALDVAPLVLDALGAEVVIVDAPHINATGVMHPQLAQAAVQSCEAGILLDGDGDRVALLTSDGAVIDGDACLWALRRGTVVVGTVMTNGGLESALAGEGISLVRAPVGDTHVAAAMIRHHALLGGEPSGHILFSDGLPTADGLLAALRTFSALRELPDKGARALLTGYVPFHQAHDGIPMFGGGDSMVASLQPVVGALEASGARVIVRPSGTEPILRLMVEHRDRGLAEAGLSRLRDLVGRQA